jgi:class 3 adenylate cyclase/tetratricopeptide (TPR) repeat protein
VPICSTCGQENPADARFCLACGTPLADEARGREERKVVTVLFADVTGSTGLAERLDAEQLKEVLEAWFRAMRDEIEAEGGTVEKFIGDAVMAAFGVPAAHEDDPARALRAALRMQRRLAVLNNQLERTHATQLEIRIGINTGEVMAVTDPRPGEAMATGDAVNAAARLQQAAEPGRILVSGRTARASRGFRFEGAGLRELRGKGTSIEAFVLVDEEPERGERAEVRAPLVGRDPEIAVLDAVFERVAAERRPHLVTVYGDAGVGKSRLVAEFLARLSEGETPTRILRGRCLPYGEGITYWPLGEILKSVAGVLESDSVHVVRSKLHEMGKELLAPSLTSDPARASAALAFTAGVEDPDVPLRDLSPRHVRNEINSAWRSFFSALAERCPVCVVVEDIHWADTALLDLLEDLAERTVGPVLFLCPARPELTGRRPSWGGGRRSFSSVFLEPLPASEAERLIELLLAPDLPPMFRQRVLDRAEGNPFFLEEIVRQLIDEGRLVAVNGIWRPSGDLEHVKLPDTVQAVLAARIDLLDPADKLLLQRAAVVGRVFWTGSVRALVSAGEDDLAEAFRRLEERELVNASLGSSFAGQEEFVFKHVLTRNVAYETLPRRERAGAHALVAAWIEESAGERRSEYLELLAYHYAEAYGGAANDRLADPEQKEALRAKAFGYTLEAAQEAVRRFVPIKARQLAEHAEALAGSPLERSRALEMLGEAYRLDLRGDEAWDALRRAVDARLEADVEEPLAIARLCGRALEIVVRWVGTMRRVLPEEEAEPYLDLGLADAGNADSEELSRLLAVACFWDYGFRDTKRHFGPEPGERAVEMAIRIGRPELALTALDALQAIHLANDRYGDAGSVVERRVEVAAGVEDPVERGDTYAMAAWHYFHVGDYRRAQAYGDEGFELTAADIVIEAGHCLSWRALAWFRIGDWKRFLSDFELLHEVLGDRAERPPAGVSRPWPVAALVHELRGESSAANRYLAHVAHLEETRSSQLGTAAPWLARTLAVRGAFSEAYERLAFVTAGGATEGAALALEAVCDVTAEAGDWDRASEASHRSRVLAQREGLLALPFFADRLEGRAAVAQGEPDVAIPLLERAVAGFAALDSRWEAATAELFLAEALADAGRGDEGAERLRGPLELFAGLSSVRELARARALQEKLGS